MANFGTVSSNRFHIVIHIFTANSYCLYRSHDVTRISD